MSQYKFTVSWDNYPTISVSKELKNEKGAVKWAQLALDIAGKDDKGEVYTLAKLLDAKGKVIKTWEPKRKILKIESHVGKYFTINNKRCKILGRKIVRGWSTYLFSCVGEMRADGFYPFDMKENTANNFGFISVNLINHMNLSDQAAAGNSNDF